MSDQITLDSLVEIGRITRPHGVKGDVRVLVPEGLEEMVQGLERLYVESPDGFEELLPKRIRTGGRYAILTLHNHKRREHVERLREKTLYARREDLPDLEEDETYEYEAIGCRVLLADGTELGTVSGIIDSPAHPVLEIQGPGGEILLPYITEFVREFRPEEKVLIVEPPRGLLDPEMIPPLPGEDGEDGEEEP